MDSSAKSEKTLTEVHGSAKLTLEIVRQGKTTHYLVRFLPSDPLIGHPAWALTKMDGSPSETVYHVILTKHGPQCDCGDAEFRSRPCKHQRALTVLGLLSRGVNP